MGREGHLQCLAWGSLPHSSTIDRLLVALCLVRVQRVSAHPYPYKIATCNPQIIQTLVTGTYMLISC